MTPRPRCPGCNKPIAAHRRRRDGSFPRYCEQPRCRVRAFYGRNRPPHREYVPRECLGKSCGGKPFTPTSWRQKYCEVCRVLPWPKRRTRKRLRAA